MSAEWDLVVVGSGHNALITAAYAARAGLRVAVVEGYGRVGGDTMTEELTLPGYRHDSCSSAHNLLQQNPLMRDDELGLIAGGLRYLRPDPVCTVPFPDGEAVTMHLDPDATEREFARLSARDARAYRELLRQWEALRPIYAAERAAPPLVPGEAEARALAHPAGRDYLRIARMSALDVIAERFEEPHVRAFLAWLATMTLEQVDRPMTGLVAMSLVAGRQSQSWTTPAGGSGALAEALAAIVRGHGGEVRTGHWVTRILVDGARAVGVRLDDGAELRARRAVVSSAPVTHLPALVGEEVTGEAFARAMARWRTGLTMFVSHYALSEAPLYRHPLGDRSAVAMGAITSVDNLLDHLHAFRRGRLHDDPVILAVNSSLVDPGRAPAGHHTLKVISYYPYALAGGAAWDDVKEEAADRLFEAYARLTRNVRREIVLARHVESPLDLERRNPSNIRGSCHGGGADPDQSGWLRPAPDWSGYRTPVAGLYLTGAGTHPGGSVSGLPGRNCARVLLADLGLPWPPAPATSAPAPASAGA